MKSATLRGNQMEIANIAIADLSGVEAISCVAAAVESRQRLNVGFINAHCVNVARRDAGYREALGEFLLLPDGIGVDVGARILHGRRFAENLNGTDFVPRLLAALTKPCRIALVGAAPGVAERAAAGLSAVARQHEIVAVADGYFGEAGRGEVLDKLAAFRPDIVLVALGVPAQELFIARHLSEGHGTVFVAVGALFDFLAGSVVRAPRPVRKLRLEWVWRLMLEPKRLFRRYVVGNPVFLKDVVLDRLRGARRNTKT
ncbi:WecB/TagA/CpsF family glycosyltransferase [Jiella mangrovi]|uniref:WecB/TagA/CpsF family glycosyltransferase n=1 Tax=Jiella mangrovi TaxID=2821407 RepID=UPI0031583B0C